MSDTVTVTVTDRHTRFFEFRSTADAIPFGRTGPAFPTAHRTGAHAVAARCETLDGTFRVRAEKWFDASSGLARKRNEGSKDTRQVRQSEMGNKLATA